ncbi:ATP-binding cassette domain-containing protein [Brevibacterium sp. 5221]|uniref:ATP-binding cassette domain-containing protein n=1 Tax=Brevibacterium rongguiense TaxID=2695267 RepID=A0A6N9H9P1_9MICO|nr:ABC transporter ATP-binding protein [Brevibacterium rongguiense]MYM20695.1 ATP-binding cassette domain-containing protein [Brevibacterium rongguiense]
MNTQKLWDAPPAPAHRPHSSPTALVGGPPLITAQGLGKAYGPTQALAGVDLAVRAGESVAIMGPSGSGKTTLLHVLAGMVLPDRGQVRIAASEHTPQVELSALSEAQRTRLRREAFGFVFQEGLLLPELSAEDNVAIAAMMKGMPRAGAAALARDWLGRLGLAEHAAKRIGQLSGGQAQRVAIARAQITEPGIVFADEPTGALDSTTSAEVLALLLRTTAGRGRTLILVTHDEQVAAACSRTVRLSDGRIVSDTAHGTTAHPAPQAGFAPAGAQTGFPPAGAPAAQASAWQGGAR